MLNICGDEGIYIPVSHCEDCDALADRVRTLEAFINELELLDITAVDNNGDTVTISVLGKRII